MTGWIIIAISVLVVLYLVLFGASDIAAFKVSKHGLKVTKGSFNPAFLSTAESILKGAEGSVKVEPEYNYMALKFKGSFSNQQRQALKNIFPEDNYRAACSAFKQYR